VYFWTIDLFSNLY